MGDDPQAAGRVQLRKAAERQLQQPLRQLGGQSGVQPGVNQWRAAGGASGAYVSTGAAMLLDSTAGQHVIGSY